jgi:lysophospholipase L1-like esterase
LLVQSSGRADPQEDRPQRLAFRLLPRRKRTPGSPKPGEQHRFYGNPSRIMGEVLATQPENRTRPGISGQTTPQLLVRFRQDVVELKPEVVVILAGTNDIAGNTGPATLEMIEGNIVSMIEIARANGIAVVLSSVLPAYDYPWKRGLEPAGKIVALNTWLKNWATAHDVVYVDYHSALADERQAGRRTQRVAHPNETGMRDGAAVEAAIAQALRK